MNENMKERLYKWLKEKIENNENYNDEYEQGLYDAYVEVESTIELGTFDTIVYVKLKPQYSILGLESNQEYEAYSVLGGEYFKIINDNIGDFQYYDRDKFEVIKIYDGYTKKFIDIEKIDIDRLNEELSK
jgi:hypothetical protein